MPQQIRCARDWRDSYTVPVGLIIYIPPKHSSKRAVIQGFEANICDQHAGIIEKYLKGTIKKFPKDVTEEDIKQEAITKFYAPKTDETLTQPIDTTIGDNHAHI